MANNAKQFVTELFNDDTERSTHSNKKRVPLTFIISLVVNLSLLMSIFETIQGPDLSFFYAIFCLNLTLISLFCYYAMKYGLPKATVYFIVLSILFFAIFFATIYWGGDKIGIPRIGVWHLRIHQLLAN